MISVRISLLFLTATLAGCNQLIHGQEQPVKALKDGIYITNCGGAVEDWGSCNRRAMITCPSSYEVISKKEDSSGIMRELVFQCKK